MNEIVSQAGELKRHLLRFLGVFLLVAASLLFLTIQKVSVSGVELWLPLAGSPTLATELFLSAKDMLVPEGIVVVALGPVASFVAPLMMAFLVSFLFTFPFLVFSLAHFLYPALHPSERRLLSRALIPSILLFYLGCSLAYFVIIPQTFAILYSFADPMEVAPLFALDDFIISVFALTVSVGIAFLLPVFMVVLARIGLVSGVFWVQHFRGALLIMLIFSALVTPDGSGVTMLFLSVPLMGLYSVGALFARNCKQSSVI